MDGGLSPFEHDELRDLVLAGTQRIRPARARPARFVLGATLLLVGALVGGIAVWAWRAASTLPDVVPGMPAPRTSVWSGWLAFSGGQGDGDIYLVRAGSSPRRILGSDSETADQVCPAFSPDGHRLVAGQLSDDGSGRLSSALVILDVSADGKVSHTTTRVLDGVTKAPCAVWSADGRYLAFGVKAGDASVEEVWVLDTGTGDIRRLPRLSATDLQWAPRASELYIASNDNGITVYSTVTDKMRILEGTSGAVAFAISPDGHQLVVQRSDPSGIGAGQPVGLMLMGADGSDQHLLGGYRVDLGIGPVWSPDGSRVVFQQLCDTYRDESGADRACVEEHEVVVMTIDQTNPLGPAVTRTVLAPPRPALGGESRPWFPYAVTWAPDGRTLLFLGWFSGGSGILAMPADGATPPAILEDGLNVAGHSGEPWNTVQSWSPQP